MASYNRFPTAQALVHVAAESRGCSRLGIRARDAFALTRRIFAVPRRAPLRSVLERWPWFRCDEAIAPIVATANDGEEKQRREGKSVGTILALWTAEMYLRDRSAYSSLDENTLSPISAKAGLLKVCRSVLIMTIRRQFVSCRICVADEIRLPAGRGCFRAVRLLAALRLLRSFRINSRRRSKF